MLVSLHVKNMALIEEQEVAFGPGLNIMTGETGAGKSILIGSLNVALGAGSFKDYVPEGADYALVELVFVTENRETLERLEKMDIPVEEGQVVISRKYQNGRSISRINGETVNQSLIRELAAGLIDIHGQHQHQSLLYPKNHLRILDEFAREDLGDKKAVCQKNWEEYRSVCRELEEALAEDADRAKQIDFLHFEIQEIEDASLRPGEDQELEEAYSRMANSQKIMEALSEARQFVGAEGGAWELAGRAARALGIVSGYGKELEDLQGELMQVEDLLGDLDRGLASCGENFTWDEEEFYRIGQRLDLINHLKAKYGKNIQDIFAYLEEKQEKLNRLTDYENYLETLRQKKQQLKERLCRVAEEISAVRKKHGKILAETIRSSLQDLNFPDVQFELDFQKLEEPGPLGMDEVCFMISMNPGMPLRPLQEVASGGELSRIMLAIKAVMAGKDEIETLIFDEIDTGISGRTAQKVSEKMAVIAGTRQVICITHLAQIAAMADWHLAIEKRVEKGRTITGVRRLNRQEQVEELARILGGVEITDAVRLNADEMKDMAERTKKY